MDEQRERDVARLAQAAREILEYVVDPGERPEPYSAMTTAPMYPRRPKSPMEEAREKADHLEAQSRAVRNLKHALEQFEK